MGMEVAPIEIDIMSDASETIEACQETRCEAMLLTHSSAAWQQAGPLSQLATAENIPLILPSNMYARRSGLFAHGADFLEYQEALADQVDKVLKGAKPPGTPIIQSKIVELIVWRGIAEKMGIALPEAVLARADRVVD